MKALTYSISAEIFKRFPGYVRGVVTARGVRNHPSPEALVQLLREAEASVRDRLKLEQVAETPRIKSWREAYRSFGAKPSEFRSSIEALVRRVLRHEPLPSINTLVDIGNVVSLARSSSCWSSSAVVRPDGKSFRKAIQSWNYFLR